MQAPVILFEKI